MYVCNDNIDSLVSVLTGLHYTWKTHWLQDWFDLWILRSQSIVIYPLDIGPGSQLSNLTSNCQHHISVGASFFPVSSEHWDAIDGEPFASRFRRTSYGAIFVRIRKKFGSHICDGTVVVDGLCRWKWQRQRHISQGGTCAFCYVKWQEWRQSYVSEVKPRVSCAVPGPRGVENEMGVVRLYFMQLYLKLVLNAVSWHALFKISHQIVARSYFAAPPRSFPKRSQWKINPNVQMCTWVMDEMVPAKLVWVFKVRRPRAWVHFGKSACAGFCNIII